MKVINRKLSTSDSPADMVEGGACLVCGEPFQGAHLRAKRTCSPSCRKALSRWPEKIESNFLRGLEIVEFLAGVQQVDDLSDKARSALATLLEAIEEALDEAKCD